MPRLVGGADWGRGLDSLLDTRGPTGMPFFLSLVFGEKQRQREEIFQSYLEQLRRPGAEAVGLSQVEGPEIRVERLIDL